jgi:soluble lytic murein transglycosylase-like protein
VIGELPLPVKFCYQTDMTRGILRQRTALKLILAPLLAASLGACSMASIPAFKPATQVAAAPKPAPKPAVKPEVQEAFVPLAFAPAPQSSNSSVDSLITKYAIMYDVPESLVRRVVQRESGFNPAARNGPYHGLMQIRHDTARSMGYSGSASGLLDAETNLKYAVKYLRGAYIVAGYNSDGAVRNYSRGYYYDAKRQGLLEEAGLR